MLANKCYDGDAVRHTLRLHGTLPIIPPKANRREPAPYDSALRDRNHVERLFNHLKQSRRIATRCNKAAPSFTSFLSLSAVKLWLNTMSTRPRITLAG
jgi:transposase